MEKKGNLRSMVARSSLACAALLVTGFIVVGGIAETGPFSRLGGTPGVTPSTNDATRAPSNGATGAPSAPKTASKASTSTAGPLAATTSSRLPGSTTAAPATKPLLPVFAPATATAVPYIVTFADGTSAATQTAVLDAVDAVEVSSIAPLGIHTIELHPDTAAASVATLRAHLSVAGVEREKVRESGAVPSDPAYAGQWALTKIGWENVFGTVPLTGTAKIAVLDTGVSSAGGDINVGAGFSAFGTDPATDPNGHGTWVASIAGATADNAKGIAGVSYGATTILPVQVLNENGIGQDSDLIQGVVWAADNGADVILMSFSNPGYSPALQTAIDYAWEQGAVIVAATGNDGASTPTYPAGDAKVVGVSATNDADELWSGSNYGDATFIAAPGVEIQVDKADGTTSAITGTSASAALVAGAAAVLTAKDPTATNGVVVGRLARSADVAGTQEQTGNGRLDLERAIMDTSSDPVQPAGAAPVGGGGPFVGPYTLAANNDSHIAPGWAATSSTVTFSTLYRKTTGGTVQHVRVTVPVGYTNISVAAMAFSSGTWSVDALSPNQATRTVDVSLTAGTGLATNNVDWARIDVTATTPVANQSGNAADWLLQTFTDTAGTAGEQNDNPPVLVGDITNPAATIEFVTAGGAVIPAPVLENLEPATLRIRVTQSGNGVKYTDIAVPTCFSSPTSVTTSLSAGGNPYTPAVVTDGFIRLSGGALAANGTLTVTFDTTPTCASGNYKVSSTPSTNATNPPSGTNQSVSTTGGSLTIGVSNPPSLTAPTFTPASPTTNTILQASTDTTDVDGDQVSVAWVWKITRGANTCTVQTASSPLAAAGTRTVSLDLGQSYSTSSCTGPTPPALLNPSKGDVVIVEATPTDSRGIVGDMQTSSVTIANSAPTVMLAGPATANEGETKTYTFTANDDDGDTLSFSMGYPDCGIGTLVGSPTVAGGTFDCTFTDDNPTGTASDPTTVKLKVTDGTDASNEATKSVTVSNVDPSVVISGAADVDEDDTETYSFNTTDTGTLDTFTHGTPSCGTGALVGPVVFSTATGDGSFDCKFADDDPTGTSSDPTSVSIMVTDDDTGSDSDSFALTVHNLDPTVVISGAADADEDDTETYSFNTTDTGTLDTFTHGTPDCGTGALVGPVVFSTATGDGSFDCKFADDDPTGSASDPTSVSITVTDDDTGSDSDSFALTVHNLDPTVVISGAANVDEDDTETYSFNTTDTGTLDTFTHGTPSCGAGALVGPVVFSTATGDGSFNCYFADDDPTGTASDPTSVSISITDDDTGSDSDSFALTVHNLDPTVVISGAADVDEDDTETYSFNTSDTGTLDTFTHGTPSCGTGALVGPVVFSTATGDGSFNCYFADDDPTGTASDPTSVSISITDDDTGSDSDSFALTVHNLDPTVVISGAADVDEDDTETYSFNTSDTGTLDTFTHGTPSCGTGALVGPVVFSTATGDGSFDCKFADDNPTGTPADLTSVSIDVSDDDLGSDTGSHGLTVHNLDPSVLVSGPADADEGETKTFTFDTTDAGVEDTFSHGTPNCGTGTNVGPIVFDSATGDGSFDCEFADDDPTGTASDPTSVSISVTDDDTGTDSDSSAVMVHNLDPSALVSGPTDANEGETKTFTFDTADAGTDTFTHSSPDCGTGALVGPVVFSPATGDGSFDCKFADDNPTGTSSDLTTVSIEVTDDDTGSDSGSHDITIHNLAPVVSLSGASTVTEGSTHTYTFTVTDAGTDTFTVSAGYPKCGLHGDYVAGSLATNPGGGSFDCTFPDGPETTDVEIKVVDDDGSSDADSEDVVVVTIGNVTPVVTAAGNQAADEGDAHSFTLGSFTDAGSDSPWDVTVDWGDGSADTNFSVTSAGSLGSQLHTYADGPNDYTVTVTVDDGTTTGSDTFEVHVNNVAPSVVLSGDFSAADEGTTRTYTYTVSDPGVDSPTVAESCGAGADYIADAAANSFACKFLDGPGSSVVNAIADDGDPSNNIGDDPHTVSIVNVAPSTPSLLSPADNLITNDNTPTFDWSDSTDPGVDTITYTIQANLGACDFSGTLEINESGLAASTFTPSTPLADGTYCWRVQATDSETDSAWSTTRNVTIDTAALTVMAAPAVGQNSPTNSSPINFTVTFNKNVTGFTDSDVSFIGSTTGPLSATVTGGPAIYNVAVTGMTSDGLVKITVPAGSATDAASNSNTASNTATVNWDATAPTVTIDQAVGQADPTSASPINFTAVFSEDVGTSFGNNEATISGTAGATTSSVTNPSSDGKTFNIAVSGVTTNGTVIVTIDANKATDAAGNGNSASTSLDNTVTYNASVGNTPPTVTINTPTFGQLYAKPGNVNLNATYTDPDVLQTHTCSVNWDDGATTAPAVNQTTDTCAQAHTYNAAGVYTIVVTICDNVGGCGSASVMIVVYDASAGFITGGGWIDVQAGSSPANPTLAGRANFGFNAKYKKGANVPDGQTEFQFQVGNLNFHSTSYTWLVVSGYKAQFKGTGAINGSGTYEFTLTAYDGQLSGGGGYDRFRIVIKQGPTLIFDNRNGASQDMDAANPQNIAGGSIVIHKA